MSEQIQIQCGAADSRGVRLVIASLGNKHHRGKFDCDNSYQRRKFREEVISVFSLGEDANEWVEAAIIAAADAEDTAGSLWQPMVTQLSTVKPAAPRWLWDQRFPLGALSLVDGDGGLGKSQMMIDIACRGSRGDALPNSPEHVYDQWGTLIITSEDADDFVLRPRIDAAEGDSRFIFSMSQVVIPEMDTRQIEFPSDIPVIEPFIVENNIRLVVIDPFTQFMGAGLSANDDKDCRRCLGPLAELAERRAIAIVLIRHLNKKTTTSARHRGGGSVAILAAVRSALLLGIDPDDSDSRVLASLKNNLSQEPPSLSFTIEQVGSTSRVRWQGESSVTANEICKADSAGNTGDRKKDSAQEIIARILADGPRGENEVKQECLDAGVSERTYWRARKSLGVHSEKTGYQGQWLLSLPISANGVCHEEF